MKNNGTYNKIHKIIEVLERGGYWSMKEICTVLKQPKGTISPLLSALVATSHIVNHNHRFKSPYFVDVLKATKDVLKHYRITRKLSNERRKAKAEKLKKIVDSIAVSTPPQLTIDVEKNFKDLAEKIQPKNYDFERVDFFGIEEAVKLLKSKGYKILAPITEFKEI